MNAKLCKRLRRQAERESVGKPARLYWERKSRIELAPGCTRHRYHELKREAA